MAVISIRATELGERLIAGIPFQIKLDANIPATMYFTLDGTKPTTSSEIYLIPIIMPTEPNTNLRVLAISGSDIGALNVTFSKDSSELPSPFRTEFSGIGIAVDAYNVENVLLSGYGSDEFGNVNVPVRFSDYEEKDLDLKFSRTGPNGIGPGTMLMMGMAPVESYSRGVSTDVNASSPNNRNVNFNPRSLYVVMDGRDGYDDQIAYTINRPHSGTLDVVKYLQGKTLHEPQPYISGGHVRTLYNQKTKTAVAYYFDHNETRWIKSIQSYENAPRLPSGIALRSPHVPLVFKWVYNKRSMI